jgi:hypothetical protein
VHWNGTTAFAIREMRALPDGFEVLFTEPVDPASAGNLEAYRMNSYTYLYSSAYGSEELDAKALSIVSAAVSRDALRVRLTVEGLRAFYVHELHASGVRSSSGAALEYSDAYYTLNRIPRAP